MSYGKVILIKYLKAWRCLAKVMLSDPKKRKLDPKKFDCMFIGYIEHSAVYRFFTMKSDMLECNTTIETKNVGFFENVFLLKSEKISHTTEHHAFENQNNFEYWDLRSKRERRETFFTNDFYTYLIDNELINYLDVILQRLIFGKKH